MSVARERVNTPDGYFLDFDWTGPGLFSDRLANGQSAQIDHALQKTAAHRWLQDDDWETLPTTPGTPALILFHGLEGSSRSHYAQAIAQYSRARGWELGRASGRERVRQ